MLDSLIDSQKEMLMSGTMKVMKQTDREIKNSSNSSNGEI